MSSDDEARSSSIRVDRCVCHGRRFSELWEQAQADGISELEALLRVADFGKKCTSCHPYVRRMLQTGETVFHELL